MLVFQENQIHINRHSFLTTSQDSQQLGEIIRVAVILHDCDCLPLARQCWKANLAKGLPIPVTDCESTSTILTSFFFELLRPVDVDSRQP